MSDYKPRPPNRRKPGGPNRRIQAYLEHDVFDAVERRAKEHGWTRSRECAALISIAIRREQQSPTPADDRAVVAARAARIANATGVGAETALRLARKEIEREAAR